MTPNVHATDLPVNTVRAYKSATPMGRRTFDAYDLDAGRLTTVEIVLSRGTASDGYKSDFDKREVWWTEMSIVGPRGRRCFGRRFSGPRAEQKARADYDEAVRLWEQYQGAAAIIRPEPEPPQDPTGVDCLKRHEGVEP